MKIRWKRGVERIHFNRPQMWLDLGVIGSGKSSFLEHIAEHQLDNDNAVLDLFGKA